MTEVLNLHEQYMSQAIDLARLGWFSTDPNPRVGCVIVKDGDIVGTGYHQFAGKPHAEVYALAAAGERAVGATAYVTLEPCSHFGRTPPCAQALIDAQVHTVVIAMTDPNPLVAGSGIVALEQAGIHTVVGVLSEQAASLNVGFIKRMQTGKPYIRCKMAMSLDGRTAMASGESQWITGVDARKAVHRLRGQSSAIITGVDTVISDNPSLTVRASAEDREQYPHLGDRQPLRVIVDSLLRTPVTAKLFDQPGRTTIVTALDASDPRFTALAKQLSEKATLVTFANDKGQVDLAQLVDWLGETGCNEVLIESGAVLAGAFLASGLIDQCDFFMAPTLLGNQAKALFQLPLDDMKQQVRLDILKIEPIGRDWHIIALPIPQVSPL